MRSVKHKCRSCKVETHQLVRFVSDLLPPNVHVLDCTDRITLSTRAAVAVLLAEIYLMGRTMFSDAQPAFSNGR